MTLLDLVERSLDRYFACLPRKRPGEPQATRARLVAHRGAHDRAQGIIENTHAAFARALALGCWGIEFDVHPTADGVLVVNHDPGLQRLWGKDLAIRDLTFRVLRQLVPEIPSLAEVVERYGTRAHLFIELKTPFNVEKSLKNSLEPLVPCEDYHLLSLNEPLFASLSSFPSAALLPVAIHNNVSQFCQTSLRKQYGGVLGHYLLLTGKNIRQLQLANQAVGVGLVNSQFSLYRELRRGVSWIFSDNAALLSECLRKLRN